VSDLPGPDSRLSPGPRDALLARLGQLTVPDLHALDATVRELRAERPYRSRVDKGFWLAWYEGPRLTGTERRELDSLFAHVVGAIAHGLTGLDVERLAGLGPHQSGGVLGDLAQLFRPASTNRPIQEMAIRLIDDAVAPWDPRLAIVACWNLACAITLRPHLPPACVEILESAWRRTLGEPPA
jgi:hypothetical protein